MAKYERFTFYCDKEERALIAAVARRLDRSQSDAVRFLVRGAAQELGIAAGASQKQPAAAGEKQGAHDARR